jgi:hypothetical protein
MLDQSVVFMFLFTVHGHVRPIGGKGRCGGGPVAPRRARVLHVSLGLGRSMLSGSDAPVLTLQGSDEAEIVSDGTQESGALTTSWGLGEAKAVPKPRTI